MIARVGSKSCLQTARPVSAAPLLLAWLTSRGHNPTSSWMVSRQTKGPSRARTEEERSLSPLPAEAQTNQGRCCLRSLPGRRILRSWSGIEMPWTVLYSLCSYRVRTGRPRQMDLTRNPPTKTVLGYYRPGPGFHSFPGVSRSVHMSVASRWCWLERTYSSSNEGNSFLPELLFYSAHPNDVHLLVLWQLHDG